MTAIEERNHTKLEFIRFNFEELFNKILHDYEKNADKDVFFSETLTLLNKTSSAIDDTLTDIADNISEALNGQNFDAAEKLYSTLQSELRSVIETIEETNKKCAEVTINDAESLDSTQKLYQKRLKSFEKEWKKQKQRYDSIVKDKKTEIDSTFEQWIVQSKQDIESYISKLDTFYSNMQKKLSNLDELIEKKQLKQAKKIIQNTVDRVINELNDQNEHLSQISPDLIPLLGDLIAKWKNRLERMENQIQKIAAPLKKQIELELIRERISSLEPFYEEIRKKLLALFSLIKNKKLTEVEKKLKNIKDRIATEIETHEKELSEGYKDGPKYLEELAKVWELKIKDTKEQVEELVSIAQNAYNKAYKPHLSTKLDLFIEQNVEAMNHLLDDFKTEAMNQIRSLLDKPKKEILDFLISEKRTVLKEFNNREKHVKLVFARYDDLEIDAKKQKWTSEYKKVQNRLNNIKTRIFNLIELKNDINTATDTYYEMAKPAYGYKVPISAISEKLEIPEDKLENLFVELISNNFITGEIDPVTKVIVLAPKVKAKQKPLPKVQILRCMVCNLMINPNKEEIIYCPHCNSPAHRAHLIEWLKIKGFCPNCKKVIKMF